MILRAPYARFVRFLPVASLGFGVLACALAACSSSGSDTPMNTDPDASACPQDLPATCPAKVPSYTTDIAPIIQGHCFPCHTTGGEEAATHNFTTYAGVYKDRSDVLSQVYSCRMPKAPSAPLSTADRALFLDWLVCHAPNN